MYVEFFLRKIESSYSGGWRQLLNMRNNFGKCCESKMRVSAVGQWKELDDVQQRTWDKITLFIECRRKKLYIWGARIASMIIVAIGVAFIWQNRSGSEMETILVSNVLQVESGSPKAILVTSAGEKIALNDGKTCQVADVSGIEIIQDSTGSVRFEDRGVVTEEEVCRYSSIVVPEKGEYQVILSDGTKVWINSDSKLEFPDRFHKNVREVKLTGEAYFEVIADPQKPFYVQVGEAKVQVLGTAFNVSAYQEDQQVELLYYAVRLGSIYQIMNMYWYQGRSQLGTKEIERQLFERGMSNRS